MQTAKKHKILEIYFTKNNEPLGNRQVVCEQVKCNFYDELEK